jgi:iron complex outermembrane receptor protein
VTGLLLATSVWVARADGPACDERLTGHVEDAWTHDHEGGVVLVAEPISGSGPSSTDVSRADGTFVLRGLCPGPHRLTASQPDHLDGVWTVQVPDEHVDLALEEASDVIRIDNDEESTEDTRAVAVLSGAALERTRGLDLGESIAELPGVALIKGTNDTTKPIIRGMYGRRLLLLQDGMRHESQQWGIDHAPEIDPFSAGSLQVVRGAAGVPYGPDAMGGAVLVDPPALRAEPGVDGSVHLVAAANGRRAVSALRVDGASETIRGLTYRFESNGGVGSALRTPDYVLGNTASRQSNIAGRVGWLGEDVQLELGWRRHLLEAGVCYCVGAESPDDFLAQADRAQPVGAEHWVTTPEIDRPKQAVSHDLAFARARWSTRLGVVGATYNFQLNRRREYDTARASVRGPQFDFLLRTSTLDVDFAHDALHLGPTVTGTGKIGVVGVFQENVYSGLPLVPNHRSARAGVFAYERLSMGDVAVDAGARYDAQAQTAYLTDSAFDRHVARGTLDEDRCTLVDDVARCPQSWDAASASLGASWRLFADRVEWKADVSTASRFPDPDEQYLNGTAPTLPVYALGNPDLGTERTLGASTTVGVRVPALTAEGSVYYNHVDGYIQFAPELGADGRPVFDVVSRGAFPRFGHTAFDARFYGFDGGFVAAPDGVVSVSGSTSIVRAERTSDGQPLVFIPPDRASAQVTGHLPPLGPWTDLFVELGGTAVARQTRVVPAADLVPAPPGYALLDLAVGGSVPVAGQTLTLNVSATNLLNQRYRDYTSLLRYTADEPGRDVRLHASLAFDL